MTPDRQLARHWRDRARALVRAHPVLHQFRRKPPGIFRRKRVGNLFRGFVPVIFFSFGLGGAPVELLLRYGALWSVCVFFSRATQLVASMQPSEKLWFYFQYPVADADACQVMHRDWLKTTIGYACDWLGLGLGVAIGQASVTLGVFSVFLAAAQTGAMVCMALWSVRKFPRVPYGLGLAFSAVLLFSVIKLQEHHVTAVQPVLDLALYATPGGWLAQSFAGAGERHWSAWLGLIGVGAATWLLVPPALALLRRDFRLEPLFGYENQFLANHATVSGAEDSMVDDRAWEEPGPDPATLPTVDAKDVRERLRDCLSGPVTPLLCAGPLEKLIRSTLRRRQRVILEQLRPAVVKGWSKGWLTALISILFARVLQAGGLDPAWCSGIMVIAVGLFALPLFGGTWAGFQAAPNFQCNIGLHSFYPIGFWESAGLMLQIHALRIVAGLPLLVAVIKFGFTPEPLSWSETWDWSARVLAGIVAIQAIWPIYFFSKTTNDTSSRWWFTVLMALALFVGIAGAVTIFIAFAAQVEFADAMICAAALNLYTFSLMTGYGLAYRFGIFDLMSVHRST